MRFLTFNNTLLAVSLLLNACNFIADDNNSLTTNFAVATDCLGVNCSQTCPTNAQLPAGLNLSIPNYFSSSYPFANWFHNAKEWDSVNVGSTSVNGNHCYGEADVDENGYPLVVPFTTSACGGQTEQIPMLPLTIRFRDFPVDQNFIIKWDGYGKLRFRSTSTVVTCSGIKVGNSCEGLNGIVEITPPSAGGLFLYIDQSLASDHLRNLRVYRASDAPPPLYLDPTYLLTPEWKRMVTTFRPVFVRFMEWMNTNSSQQASFATRPRETHSLWSRRQVLKNNLIIGGGVPLETIVKVAHELNVDPWFNIPHQYANNSGSPDIQQMAQLIKHQMLALQMFDANIYVEFSNELWNDIFTQYDWVSARASEVGLSRPFWIGDRIQEMSNIFRTTFGIGANHVRIIVGGFLSVPNHAESILTRLPNANSDVYAVAVAPYMGGKIATQTYHSLVNPDFDVCTASTGEIMAEMRYSLNTPPGYQDNDIEYRIRRHVALVNSKGINRLVAYEGGQGLAADFTTINRCAALTPSVDLSEKLIRINENMQMYDRYVELAQLWNSFAPTTHAFGYFEDASDWDQYGSWGLLRSLKQFSNGISKSNTPKYYAAFLCNSH